MRWFKRGTVELAEKPDKAAQFWANVDRESGPMCEQRGTRCWLWKGSQKRTSDGYGRFTLNGKEERAHRVAFYFANGHWPEPLACHHCDNPPCVNPDHLFEGTPLDNTRDMIAKGRSAFSAGHAERRLKATCHRGHEWTPENTLSPTPGVRQCKICRRAATKAWKEKRKPLVSTGGVEDAGHAIA